MPNTTTLTYDPLTGLLDTQLTIYPRGRESLSDSSKYYYRHKDNYELSAVTTTRTNRNGSKSSTSSIFQGPNGEMNAVLNATNGTVREDRYFTATPDGLVSERNNVTKYLALDKVRYFHSTNGDVLGNIDYTMGSNDFLRIIQANTNSLNIIPAMNAGGGFPTFSSPSGASGKSNLYSVVHPQSFGDTALGQTVEGAKLPTGLFNLLGPRHNKIL